MTTAEKNAEIASFMGFKKHGNIFTLDNRPFEITDLKYHSDWNWLHEVISKIIDLVRFKTVDECTKEEWFQMTRITKMYIGIDIEVAHEYCFQFIQWYNQQKQ